jgi:fumarylacetoacetase
MIDFTHDAAARSWVAEANEPDCAFPLQNLPFGIVEEHAAVAIGDRFLDLHGALDAGLLECLSQEVSLALRQPRLNTLFGLGREAMRQVRHAVFEVLKEGSQDSSAAAACLHDQSDVQPQLPCEIGDYTDFFTSLNHARNTFNIFRPGQEFLPNYKHLPIAYHGRSSSIVASPTDVRRPWGQIRPDPKAGPVFSPSRKVDFEVELGFFVGAGNRLGSPVALDEAEEHLAGVCILNDWSARDIQGWESQPLGPFLSKNFVSTVSPWVVTLDALAPFRAPLVPRENCDPPLLPYLDSARNAQHGAFEIVLETILLTASMRMENTPPTVISRAVFSRDVWWTPAQMVAHHTVGGCNLRPGDLLGSGTVSGNSPGTEGSLIELTAGAIRPLELPNGAQRTFLEDGDEIVIRAWCERDGVRRIGLGECTGRIVPKATSEGRQQLEQLCPAV